MIIEVDKKRLFYRLTNVVFVNSKFISWYNASYID